MAVNHLVCSNTNHQIRQISECSKPLGLEWKGMYFSLLKLLCHCCWKIWASKRQPASFAFKTVGVRSSDLSGYYWGFFLLQTAQICQHSPWYWNKGRHKEYCFPTIFSFIFYFWTSAFVLINIWMDSGFSAYPSVFSCSRNTLDGRIHPGCRPVQSHHQVVRMAPHGASL